MLGGINIIFLYSGTVLGAFKLLRAKFFPGPADAVLYYELPDVDLLLHLCLDIYLVRQMKEYWLEEELFAKLVFLYRSPETLIQYTQHRWFINAIPDG